MNTDLTPQGVFSEYERGESYNRRIELYENVRKNEDFYIGDQWKGVYAPDLEKPVLNFIKRTVSYLISMIVSDDVGVSVTPSDRGADALFLADTLGGEVESVIEHTKAKTLARDMLKSCAVDGDGCFYFWFEPTGGASGRIRIENIDNTRIIFGNPYCREVEDQPYIIIMRRRPAADLMQEAKAAGNPDWEAIAPEGAAQFDEDGGDKMATELIRLWKENGTVHFMSTARNCGRQRPSPLSHCVDELGKRKKQLSRKSRRHRNYSQPDFCQQALGNGHGARKAHGVPENFL